MLMVDWEFEVLGKGWQVGKRSCHCTAHSAQFEEEGTQGGSA
jgi:hypothetical protein